MFKFEDYLISEPKLRQMCNQRWERTTPGNHLTWGLALDGDAFIQKISKYNVFSHEKNVLEIGPGYGRLIETCLKYTIPFKKYVGVDLAKNCVDMLNKKYSSKSISFVHDNVETISFDNKFDLVISTTVFKHLFPSFENALRHIVSHANPGCYFFFDIAEDPSSSCIHLLFRQIGDTD